MPKSYSVTFPITGSWSVLVEAESEEEALEKAYNTDPDEGELTWTAVERVVQGNVFYGELNEIDVTEES